MQANSVPPSPLPLVPPSWLQFGPAVPSLLLLQIPSSGKSFFLERFVPTLPLYVFQSRPASQPPNGVSTDVLGCSSLIS